ncbi:MAG: response regulator, partial [Comamonadaceae bacterium]
MTRVLLVDDHALIRRGMRDALADEGVQVVGEAACWDELDPLLAMSIAPPAARARSARPRRPSDPGLCSAAASRPR